MNKTILFLKSYANSFWKIQCFVLYVNLWLPDSAKKKKKKGFIERHNMFLWHQKVLAKHCCAELVENESET